MAQQKGVPAAKTLPDSKYTLNHAEMCLRDAAQIMHEYLKQQQDDSSSDPMDIELLGTLSQGGPPLT